jgi:hypothetical protein
VKRAALAHEKSRLVWRLSDLAGVPRLLLFALDPYRNSDNRQFSLLKDEEVGNDDDQQAKAYKSE